MRNADGSNPDAPARKGVVVYLSEDARSVLRRNRVERQLLRSQTGPSSDSELVESLLLAFEAGPTGDATSTDVGPKPHTAGAIRAKALARVIELRRRLRAATGANSQLRGNVDSLQERLKTLSAQAVATESQKDFHGLEEGRQLSGASWDKFAHQLLERQRASLWLWAPAFLETVRDAVLSEAKDPELIRMIARELDEHVAKMCDRDS
jgi:hypothetical protein